MRELGTFGELATVSGADGKRARSEAGSENTEAHTGHPAMHPVERSLDSILGVMGSH